MVFVVQVSRVKDRRSRDLDFDLDDVMLFGCWGGTVDGSSVIGFQSKSRIKVFRVVNRRECHKRQILILI